MLSEYCARTGQTALLSQWDAPANAPLTPETVPHGSHQKVWWVCGRGHRWQAAVKARSFGSGCPYCANRAVSPENSLAVTDPALAKQWHPEKNGRLTPGEVIPGSQRRVWWRCDRGHTWQAQIASRAGRGAGCPYCTGKLVIPGENDLQRVFPEIAAQWHPEKNGALQPQMLHAYSNRKVWWRCQKGHAYRAAVNARAFGKSGCPYCANRKILPGCNDLATLAPEVAKQWHPTLNGVLTPEAVTVGSAKKVWWQCAEGHTWKAVIYSRTGARKHGCPVCAGNVKMLPLGP